MKKLGFKKSQAKEKEIGLLMGEITRLLIMNTMKLKKKRELKFIYEILFR